MDVDTGRGAAGAYNFTSAAELAEALEAGAVGVWRWEVASGRLTWSHNLEAIHGLPPGAFDGTFEAFARDIHPDDRERVLQEIGASLKSSDSYRVLYRLPADDAGATRWLEARGVVIRDERGEPVTMTGVCHDVSAYKEAEAELALRARQHEAVAALGEKALSGGGLDDVLREAARLATELLTADFAEILEFSQDRGGLTERAGCGWTLDPDGNADANSASAARASGPETLTAFTAGRNAPVVFTDIAEETRFVLSDRAAAHGVASGAAVAIGGPNGRPFGVFAVYCVRRRCIGPTDLRFLQSVANVLGSAVRAAQDDERKELLIGELRHRVGNLFSLVQALHRQTGQSAVDARDLEMKFGARLAALAGAHTLILDAGWQRASLRSLLGATLAPYSDRVEFAGDDVHLSADAAFSFSMALHEMATNANKYGSLSAERGRLRIETGTVSDERGRRIVLEWKECDGPPPPDATTEGFGSKLIAQVVERQLGGHVTRRVESDGLRFTIEIPAS
jgi:PAS domain S-box-containing protein